MKLFLILFVLALALVAAEDRKHLYAPGESSNGFYTSPPPPSSTSSPNAFDPAVFMKRIQSLLSAFQAMFSASSLKTGTNANVTGSNN